MRIRLACVAVALTGLALPALAHADHRELVQVSRSADGGNSSNYTTFGGVSADGSKMWFSTADALVPEDTDNLSDVYERSEPNGKLTLMSVPDEGGPYGGDQPAGFATASADGSTVVFSSTEQFTGDDDDDGAPDWFARRGGHTYLVSKPDPDAFILLHGAPLAGQVTPDGTHVFFVSFEDMVPSDSNFTGDLYEWRAPERAGPAGPRGPRGRSRGSAGSCGLRRSRREHRALGRRPQRGRGRKRRRFARLLRHARRVRPGGH